jgi:hypothetical protein
METAYDMSIYERRKQLVEIAYTVIHKHLCYKNLYYKCLINLCIEFTTNSYLSYKFLRIVLPMKL